MPRLKILSVSEQNEFDSPPILSGDSRKSHFRFNQIVQEMVKPIKGNSHRIGFVLMFYYFKIVQKFFSPKLFYATNTSNTSSGKVYNSYASYDSTSSDSLLPLYDVAREYKTGVGQYTDSRVKQKSDYPFSGESSSASRSGSFFSRIDFSPEQNGAGIGVAETDFYGRYLPSPSLQDEIKTVKIYDVKSGAKIDSNNHGLKKDSFVRNGKEVTSYRNSLGQFTKKPSLYNYSINTQIPLINLGGQEYSLVLIDSREITLGDKKVQTGMTAYTKSPHIFSGFNKGLNASMGWHSGILVGSADLGDGSNLSAHILETLGIAGFNIGKSGLGAKLGFKGSLANTKYTMPISETCFRYACFEGDVTIEAGIGIGAKAEIGLSKSKAKFNLGSGAVIQGELSVDLSISKNKEYLAAQQKRTEQIQAKYDHFNAEIKKYTPDVIARISMMDLYDFGNHQDFESILLLAKEYSKR